jgi:hypothetical protein
MPDASMFTEILAELAVLHQIEQGLADLDAARVIDHETAKLRLSRRIGTDQRPIRHIRGNFAVFCRLNSPALVGDDTATLHVVHHFAAYNFANYS